MQTGLFRRSNIVSSLSVERAHFAHDRGVSRGESRAWISSSVSLWNCSGDARCRRRRSFPFPTARRWRAADHTSCRMARRAIERATAAARSDHAGCSLAVLSSAARGGPDQMQALAGSGRRPWGSAALHRHRDSVSIDLSAPRCDLKTSPVPDSRTASRSSILGGVSPRPQFGTSSISTPEGYAAITDAGCRDLPEPARSYDAQCP